MLQNINIKPIVTINQNNDAIVAKNIVDILFVFIDGNIRNDKKMTGFTKGLVLSQLPGIRNSSRDYINDIISVDIRKLLDDIQNQLKSRR